MSIDEELRQGASDVRRDAAHLVGSMSPPPPPTSSSSRRGASIGATALALGLVVGLAILIATRDRPALAPATDTSRASPFVPILDRPGYFRYDSKRLEFWLPSSGWNATSETLTPHLGEVDVGGFRDADTILSLSTKPFAAIEPAGTTNCRTMPFAALAALDPTDALVSVVETSFTGLPDRRRATGIYDGEPERLYPYIGELSEDGCLDRIRERGDPDLFYRQYTFIDAERGFTVHVALGSATTPSQQRDVWRILDRLAFDPPTALDPSETPRAQDGRAGDRWDRRGDDRGAVPDPAALTEAPRPTPTPPAAW